MYTDIPENPRENAVSDREIQGSESSLDINDDAVPISKKEIRISDIMRGIFMYSIHPANVEKKIIYADTYIHDCADDFIDDDSENTLSSKYP